MAGLACPSLKHGMEIIRSLDTAIDWMVTLCSLPIKILRLSTTTSSSSYYHHDVVVDNLFFFNGERKVTKGDGNGRATGGFGRLGDSCCLRAVKKLSNDDGKES